MSLTGLPLDGRRERLATYALVGICLVWGATFTVIKTALDDVSAVLFLALRFGVATFALWLGLRSRSPIRVDRPVMGAGFLLGLALFGGYLFQTVGLRFTTPSRSAFLTGLFIVLVPLMAAMVQRRLPSPSEAGGVLLAFAGMALLSGPVTGSPTAQGDLLTIVCAVCYAVHILALGHFARRHDTRTLALLQVGFTFLFSLAAFWWVEPVRFQPGWGVWMAVAFTGVLATAIAFLVQTWAQRVTSPTRTALIFALEPVFAWVTAFLVLGEHLVGWSAVGALLILTGVVVVELRLLEQARAGAGER
ncbi:MAG: DMT family transporter [Bryobacterales bacterium]|jgi:drug/metabolite transporter (DMT)-like permease|nr:DMT family transporter [Bryobacterales bacterium]